MSKNKYIVYFEIYGKKMKSKVSAKSMYEAEKIISSKLIINKTVLEKDDYKTVC